MIDKDKKGLEQMTTSNNPDQPIITDQHSRQRFKANEIVRYLLDNGGIDLNRLATINFSVDDRIQFAQLIGYSVVGFSELSYVTDDRYDRAIGREQEQGNGQGEQK